RVARGGGAPGGWITNGRSASASTARTSSISSASPERSATARTVWSITPPSCVLFRSPEHPSPAADQAGTGEGVVDNEARRRSSPGPVRLAAQRRTVPLSHPRPRVYTGRTTSSGRGNPRAFSPREGLVDRACPQRLPEDARLIPHTG